MKRNSPMNLRKLLMLLAAVALLVSLAGCFNGTASDDPSDEPSGTTSQTDGSEPTDAPADPTEPEETEPPAVMGTVTHDNLRVRSNPSTDSTVLKQLDINTRVLIIEQKVVGDVSWGRIAEGWVNMSYILIDGEEPAPTDPVEEPTEAPSDNVVASGTITASELNIRKGAGTSYDSVGKYKNGDKVEILEVKNGWGRTDKGWISMKYVKQAGSSTNDDKTTEDDDKTTSEIVSDGKTKVLGYGVVDIGSLNVRSGPGTKYDKIDKVSEGDRYAYYQKSGNWVRIKEGWISTSYFYIEGTKGEKAGTGVIVGSDLNIRIGPGTGYKTNGSYDKGDKVEILHQIDGWGCTSKGWISMKYVDMDGKDDDKETTSKANATITGQGVNIRKGPGTDNDKVGQYNKGDRVEVLETKDGWCRTDKGWVSADYVKKD